MALVLQASVAVKQRIQAFPGLPARLAVLVNNFLSLLTQCSGDPDLQVLPFSVTGGSATLLSGSKVRLYAAVGFVAPVTSDDIFWYVADGLSGQLYFFSNRVNLGQQTYDVSVFYPSGILFPIAGVQIISTGVDPVRGFLLVGSA